MKSFDRTRCIKIMSAKKAAQTVSQCVLLMSLGLILLSGCGAAVSNSGSSVKIVGGRSAEAASFHAVALFRPDSTGVNYVFCSGVLLTPRHVLTAAHCSLKQDHLPYNTSDLYVIAGRSKPEATDKSVSDDGSAKVAVRTMTIHPAFNQSAMGKESNGVVALKDANDLAVWELAEPVKNVSPAAVLNATDSQALLQASASLTITGFGQKSGWESPWEPHEFAVAETNFTTEYQQKKTETVTDAHGRMVKKVTPIKLPSLSAGEFYAGGTGQPDTCKGDSGAPVFAKSPSGQLLLLGLTSRGSSVCETGGVYTRVGAHLPWLEAVASGMVTQGLSGL